MIHQKAVGLLRANVNGEPYLVYDTALHRVGIMYNHFTSFVNSTTPVAAETTVVIAPLRDLTLHLVSLIQSSQVTVHEYARHYGLSRRLVLRFARSNLGRYLGCQCIEDQVRLPSLLHPDLWTAALRRERNDDKRRLTILRYLTANGPTLVSELAFWLKGTQSRDAIKATVSRMVADGLLRRTGIGRGSTVQLTSFWLDIPVEK